MASRMKAARGTRGKANFSFLPRIRRNEKSGISTHLDHQSIMLEAEDLIDLRDKKDTFDKCKSFEYGFANECGKRDSNEDRITLHYCKNDMFIFCLFDGHEGEGMANYLSQNLPQYLTTPCKDLYLKVNSSDEYQYRNLDSISPKSLKHSSSSRVNLSVKKNLMSVFEFPRDSECEIGEESDDDTELRHSVSFSPRSKAHAFIPNNTTTTTTTTTTATTISAFIEEENENFLGGWKSSLNYCWTKLDERWKNTERKKSLLKMDVSGSTASCIVFHPYHNPLVSLGVGDSQIIGYTREEGRPIRLCELHKPSVASEKIRIKQAGGDIISKSKSRRVARVALPGTRGNHGLAISRAFGDISYKSGAKVGYGKNQKLLRSDLISAVPDIQAYHINAFELIVMASDGLWDVMKPQKVYEFIKQKIEVRGTKTDLDMQKICQQLVHKAVKDDRCDDNVSVIILYLDVDTTPSVSLTKLTPRSSQSSLPGLTDLQTPPFGNLTSHPSPLLGSLISSAPPPTPTTPLSPLPTPQVIIPISNPLPPPITSAVSSPPSIPTHQIIDD